MLFEAQSCPPLFELLLVLHEAGGVQTAPMAFPPAAFTVATSAIMLVGLCRFPFPRRIHANAHYGQADPIGRVEQARGQGRRLIHVVDAESLDELVLLIE